MRFKAAATVMALAFCIIVPLVLNNMFLILPALVFCIGTYETAVVLTKRAGANHFADGSMKYSFFWGVFTIFIGLLTLLMAIELIWVLCILMAWLASVVPLFSMRSRIGAGGRDNMQVLNTIRR
jgi:hypothetical protein